MSTLSLRQRHDPLRPPEAPGLGRGMVFALIAHVLLIAAISANIQWHTTTLPTAEAELWSVVPRAAAPKEEVPPPAPEPEAKPDPKPPAPPQPTAEEVQAQRDANIAIARAKEQKKREEEQRVAALEEQKRLKALKDKADQEKLEKQKAEDKAKADKLEKEKQDKLDKLKAEKQKQQDQTKDAKAQKEADAKVAAQRQENLKRIMGLAGASGGPTATGSAMKSSGPSATYGGRVVARVRPNIVYADNPAGNPEAVVVVRIAPDGTIVGKKLTKSSGLPEWDNAVLRAIDKTETLPRDVDGSVPSSLEIAFKPHE